MKKPATKYSEKDVKARFDRALNGALSAPRIPLITTATLKRRALKKKTAVPKKNAGKVDAIPAVPYPCTATETVTTTASGKSATTGRLAIETPSAQSSGLATGSAAAPD